MSEAHSKPARNGAPKRQPKLTYRGIELQRPYGEPTIPLADIERAVANAFAKHAPALERD